jgi:hypothetical protein
MEIRAFQTKENRLPTTRPSTKMSSLLKAPGARIEVSQYGGAESAAACSYVYDKVSMERKVTRIWKITYRRLLVKLFATSRLRGNVGKDTVIGAASTTDGCGGIGGAASTRKEHINLGDPTA